MIGSHTATSVPSVDPLNTFTVGGVVAEVVTRVSSILVRVYPEELLAVVNQPD